ncbi:MAG: aldehyde dehydrogenase family protein [Acidimicrobiales bacterium]
MTDDSEGAVNHPVVEGERRLLIDGKLVEASEGGTFDNIDPTTEEVLGVTADATAVDMDLAIAAARRAFDDTDWATNRQLRSRCLGQLHAALVENLEELRQITVAEVGSPISLTYMNQVDLPLEDLAYWIDKPETYEYEEVLPDRDVFGQAQRRVVVREPVGVVGAITPWNFPLNLNLAKLGPALAAGNTVVLKPAPDTPWSATVLGRIIAEQTDIPPGVVNVVAASDHLVGEVLTSDPRVDMITFTGSTVTGRRIMASASATVKKVFLELGGKSANIVLDDVEDASMAIGVSALGVCTHSGQGCAIATRLLLPRSRYAEWLEQADAMMGSATYGDPWDSSNLQGPLINARQRERVLGYIAKGREEGATVVRGGGVPSHLPKGYFVEPTLFGDVNPHATIAQEEIFGPVLCVIPYDDIDEAVRIANGTMYGLSAAVTGGTLERANVVARRLRAGTVMVNGGFWNSPDVPFGGYGQSGVGRENGRQGFEEYLEIKALAYPVAQA